jgi:probable HAF family extracellular repeat protein
MSDLGTLGGTSSGAYGINNAGQVMGTAFTSGGVKHAFLYSEGSMSDLGTLGGTHSEATGINPSSEVDPVENFFCAISLRWRGCEGG